MTQAGISERRLGSVSEWSEQANIIHYWLSEHITPPILFEEYLLARYTWFHTDEMLSDDELEAVIACGNHWGALMRTTYLKFVRRHGFDPAMFWDALLLTFLWGRVWVWESLFQSDAKRIRRWTQRYSHPEWVRVALCGADWAKIRKMCEAFCDAQERLELVREGAIA